MREAEACMDHMVNKNNDQTVEGAERKGCFWRGFKIETFRTTEKRLNKL